MRTIIQGDALQWLREQRDGSLPNIITGICDMEETPYSLEEYKRFFHEAVVLMTHKINDQGYLILIQTDRKVERSWIDKATLAVSAAEGEGSTLRWHKIYLNREPGATNIYRPGYSHLLCFSRRGTPGSATADVLPFRYKDRLYENGTPISAAEMAVLFVKRYHPGKIVDPFVGRGTILAVANRHGLEGLGVDLDEEQCKIATSLNC